MLLITVVQYLCNYAVTRTKKSDQICDQKLVWTFRQKVQFIQQTRVQNEHLSSKQSEYCQLNYINM